MERTYAHIDLDERRKIARWHSAKLSVDVTITRIEVAHMFRKNQLANDNRSPFVVFAELAA